MNREDQLHLGFEGPVRRAPAPGGPGSAHDCVWFGTSSFAWQDWVGPFYPAGTAPSEFLRVYAERFRTVEIDSTYYSVPSARTVDGWAAKTPPQFRIAAKFPRSIVHGGDGPRPDPARVLDPEATAADRDAFLAVMARLGPRLGPLVLQFPYFAKSLFAGPEAFFERLDRFLAALPPERPYAVEIRNPRWIGAGLADVCRRHGAAVVLVDQEWMPHGDRVAHDLDVLASPFAYVRLLGDRKEIEAQTTTWDREVLDRQEQLERWAALLVRFAEVGLLTYVFVNNHYAGHAPATVRRLEALFEARRAGGGTGRPAPP